MVLIGSAGSSIMKSPSFESLQVDNHCQKCGMRHDCIGKIWNKKDFMAQSAVSSDISDAEVCTTSGPETGTVDVFH